MSKGEWYRQVSFGIIGIMAMTLRLTDEDNEALRAAADREGRSMQDVVTTALREYLAKRDEFRTQQVNRFLAEDSELLELLSR